MCFNIEYSCHTITNIIHGRRLSLQLMTNSSLTCNYSNACLIANMKFSQEFNEMQENTVKPSWILNAGNHIII